MEKKLFAAMCAKAIDGSTYNAEWHFLEDFAYESQDDAAEALMNIEDAERQSADLDHPFDTSRVFAVRVIDAASVCVDVVYEDYKVRAPRVYRAYIADEITVDSDFESELEDAGRKVARGWIAQQTDNDIDLEYDFSAEGDYQLVDRICRKHIGLAANETDAPTLEIWRAVKRGYLAEIAS